MVNRLIEQNSLSSTWRLRENVGHCEKWANNVEAIGLKRTKHSSDSQFSTPVPSDNDPWCGAERSIQLDKGRLTQGEREGDDHKQRNIERPQEYERYGLD